MIWISGATITMGIPFMEITPEFLCYDDNASQFFECSEKQACNSNNFMIKEPAPQDVITEFELYCDRKYLVSTIATVFFFGFMVGAYVLSNISDRIGRLRTLSGITLATIALSAVGCLAWNIWVFLMVMGVFGFLIAGGTLVSFVHSAEYLGNAKRHVAAVYLTCGFGIQQILIAVVSYYTSQWRYLFLLTLVSALVYLALMSRLDESPRYLFVKGNYFRLLQALTSVAQRNGNNMFRERIKGKFSDLDSESEINGIDDITVEEKESPSKAYTLYHLMIYKSLRLNTILCCLEWYIVSFSYYGTAFILPMLDANIYVMGVLMGISEICALLFNAWVLEFVGRKTCFAAAMFPAAICCALTAYTQNQWALLFYMTVMKFVLSSAFNSIYTLSSEAFPTVIRNTATGVCSLVARIGGMTAPVTLFIGEVIGVNPMIFFAISCSIGAAISLVLPETKDVDIPDTILEETSQETEFRTYK